MNDGNLLTIATVTFNSLAYTKLFLESLKRNSRVPYNIIVVDNHSTDGTIDFLKRQKDVRVIFNRRNLGFGWANNQAFALCRTPYFLVINNDTVIFPGFLERLLEMAEKSPDYAGLGVNSNCIGAVDPRTGKDIRLGLGKLESMGLSPERIVRHYYGNQKKFFSRFYRSYKGFLELETPPNFIGGWCFLVHTEAVKQVGGLFDRRFKIGFWEDVDLSWRLALSGFKIGLVENIYLHHFGHVSFISNKLCLTDKAISRANGLRFAEKWSEEIRKFLQKKFENGCTLAEIIRKYFIFEAYFRRWRNLTEIEKALKRGFLLNRKKNFRDFLLELTDE